MRTNWSYSAMEMLAEIHEYISEKSEFAADKYIDGIYDSISKLEEHTESCGVCRNQKLMDHGFRCCKYKSHIIIYMIEAKSINILAVIHSKRNPTQIIKDIGL